MSYTTEERRLYQRAYRLKHKEREKERQHQDYIKHKDERNEKMKKLYQAKRETLKEARYYNTDPIVAIAKIYI
tara:strand:+ start:394 stop:612 length:219 start_codon:yes stop_codon:yes gene_type:complete